MFGFFKARKELRAIERLLNDLPRGIRPVGKGSTFDHVHYALIALEAQVQRRDAQLLALKQKYEPPKMRVQHEPRRRATDSAPVSGSLNGGVRSVDDASSVNNTMGLGLGVLYGSEHPTTPIHKDWAEPFASGGGGSYAGAGASGGWSSETSSHSDSSSSSSSSSDSSSSSSD